MTATRYQRRQRQTFGMRRRRRFDWGTGTLVVIAIVVLIIGVFAWSAVMRSTESFVDVQVVSKERVCSGSGDSTDCKYLVFTEQGTYKVSDTILYGNFRSSDVYGRLREDRCYTFKVVGWRLPFFSTYKNVVEVKDKAC